MSGYSLDELTHRIKSLNADVAELEELNDKLVAALEEILDPPSTLDEPDTDVELILTMRRIAREALADQQTTEKP